MLISTGTTKIDFDWHSIQIFKNDSAYGVYTIEGFTAEGENYLTEGEPVMNADTARQLKEIRAEIRQLMQKAESIVMQKGATAILYQ